MFRQMLQAQSVCVCVSWGTGKTVEDRRPRQTSRCYVAAWKKKNHSAAIMRVENSVKRSTVCSPSISAALTASHTTSSLGQGTHSLWFGFEELMQRHLDSQSHPFWHMLRIQPASLRLCIIFFKRMKCGHPCSVLSNTSLFSWVLCEGQAY